MGDNDGDGDRGRRMFEQEFTPELYDRMRDDDVRTGAYRVAIAATVPGKVVLDLGTGCHALLALMCAEAGARRVYAVEVNRAAAALARDVVAKSPYKDVVHVVEGWAADTSLPEAAEVVVHEILGDVASEEGVVAALLDAGRRLTTRPVISVPLAARTWAVPVKWPAAYDDDGEVVSMKGKVYRMWPVPSVFDLAAPQVLEDLDFGALLDSCEPGGGGANSGTDDGATKETPTEDRSKEGGFEHISGSLRFPVTECGVVSGILLYLDVTTTTGECFNTRVPRTSWRNIVMLLGKEVEVEAPDIITMGYTIDRSRFPCRYDFDVSVMRGDEIIPVGTALLHLKP